MEGSFLGGVDHEDGEFVLDGGVVGFLDVCTVHFEGFLRAEEGGSGADGVLEVAVGVVEGGGCRLWVGNVEEVDIGDGAGFGGASGVCGSSAGLPIGREA